MTCANKIYSVLDSNFYIVFISQVMTYANKIHNVLDNNFYIVFISQVITLLLQFIVF